MKINPDCVREVMLCLEENLSVSPGPNGYYFQCMTVPDIEGKLCPMGYTTEDVAYSALQLLEAHYIVCSTNSIYSHRFKAFNPWEILYITPKGHEFIAAIHDKESWVKKISPILSSLGSVSLSVIESVSKGIFGAMIDRFIP